MKTRHLFALLLLLFSVRLFGQGVVYETDEHYNGNRLYCAGVKTDIFKFYAASQEYDCWCWAACVQMVLNYQGVYVEQKDLVKKAFGIVTNKGGTGYDIVKAANGWYVKGKTIAAQMGGKSQFDLINDLAYHYPVIIGLNMPGQNMGHAYVLTAVFYYYDSYKRKVPTKVVLRDPWPYNESRTVLTWYDFYNRINCIVHVYPQN
jgi:hypothetical protein